MNIIEGNEKIAVFEGWLPKKTYWWHAQRGFTKITNEFRYDKDWREMMPIVEKIESIHDEHHGYFGVHICSNGCTIQATNFRSDKPMADPPHYFAETVAETKIEAVWQAVVSFLTWLETSKPTL